tara:strand:- start:674 stop:910 length:237 start_codon:yes stop_codon:yes gene_type:complete
MLEELKRIDNTITKLHSEDAIRDFDRELKESCRKANMDTHAFKLGWVMGRTYTLIEENVAQKRELEKLRELHKQASAK